MNIQYLRNFYVIARLGNITKAAEVVHRTQSTLSSQIKNLENTLGTPLLERAGRKSVILTPAGEALLEFTKGLLQQYDELEMRLERIQSLSEEESGRLRIGAAPSVMDNLLPGFIPAFQKQHPNISIQLFSRSPAEIIEKVKEGFLDIGISLDSAVPKNFLSYQWIPLRLTLMVPFGHPLEQRSPLTLQDIMEYPLIMPTNSRFLTRIIYDQQVMDMGMEPNIVLESDYNITHARYVHAGFGISFMYLSETAIEAFRKKIRCIDLDFLAPPLHLKIFHRKSTDMNIVATFVQFMESYRGKPEEFA